MATYYWVGGSGTWDGVTATRWSLTSGGAGGAGVPTSDDSVIFNAASSGVSYVVQCDSNATCGQITTSAPATGTLTFSTATTGAFFYFTVLSYSLAPTINIHAACLFSGPALYDSLISISNYASTTTSITFNGSGTNTQAVVLNVGYAAGNVNFCLSQTCTFAEVGINMSGTGTFTCTASNITVNRNVAGRGGSFYVGGAATISMAGTNIVAGSLTTLAASANISIGDSSATAWSVAGLNLTARANSSSNNNAISVGTNSLVAHPTIGAVLIEGPVATINNAFLAVARCTTLTVRDTDVQGATSTGNDPIFSVSGAVSISTTAGALAFTQLSMAGGFSTVTFGSTFTVTGQATNYARAIVTGTATLASLSVTDGTFGADGAITISGATTLTRSNIQTTFAQGYTLTTGDITSTGQTATAGLVNSIQVDTLVCSSLTMTNTRLQAIGATINGGVGKTFSFTVNASAPADGRYPDIQVYGLIVSTPTMSIVGTVTKRVVCSYGSSSSAVWAITPTPTLQYVTFIKTQINNGVSNYTGTALGTDGLSVGFVRQAPRSVYCVAAGTQNFDAAIWATTPGGVGSTANYPLPQDTIIFTTAIVGVGNITLSSPSITLYLGSITIEASTNTVSIAPSSSAEVQIFGSLYTSTTTTTSIGESAGVVMAASDLTTRYVSGNWALGFNGSFSLSANDNNPTYNFPSGTLTTTSLQIPLALGGGLNVNTDGLTSINCYYLIAYLGNINFASTAINATEVSFSNPAPSLNIADTPYTLTLTAPFVGLATYTNDGNYRGGLVVLQDGAASGFAYAFRLQGLNVRRLTLSSAGASASSRTVTLNSTGATVKDFTTAGSAVSWTFNTNGAGRTITKTEGGRVQLTGNLVANAVSASPANTWYVSGTLSQTGGATGWVQGVAPSNNGGFLFF